MDYSSRARANRRHSRDHLIKIGGEGFVLNGNSGFSSRDYAIFENCLFYIKYTIITELFGFFSFENNKKNVKISTIEWYH